MKKLKYKYQYGGKFKYPNGGDIKDNIRYDENGNPIDNDILESRNRQYKIDLKDYYNSISRSGLTEDEYIKKYPNEHIFNKKKFEEKFKNRFNSDYKNNVFDGGGNMYGALGTLGTLGGQYGKQYATNVDGSVNSNAYAASSALEMGGQGAALGSMIAPGIGTAIGFGAGAIGGYFMGESNAGKINEQVKQQHIEEEKRKREIASADSTNKAMIQDNWNKAYATFNSPSGNVGASMYGMYGGKFKYGHGGGFGDPQKKLIDRTKYQSTFDRFDKTGALEGEVAITPDAFKDKYYDANTTANMKAQGFEKRTDSIDRYPVYTNKEGTSTLIRHPNSGSYVNVGAFNNLNYTGGTPVNTSAPVTMNRISTPTTVAPLGTSVMNPAQGGTVTAFGTFNGKTVQTYKMPDGSLKYMTPQGEDMSSQMAGTLNPNENLVKTVNAYGGNIHIKPSHRGMFTAYKARTGKTTEEALHSSDPHVRQMANFARNAAKWHHALGGFLPNGNNIEANGGILNPLASDITKAVGNTHEEGGIKLSQLDNKPFAEIEGEEVVKGTKVYSDRLKLNNGRTVAEEAEKLGRKKGKLEERVESNSSRTSNGAKRQLQFVDKKLNDLFNYQEENKSELSNYAVNAYGGLIKYGMAGNLIIPETPDTTNTSTSPNKFNWNNALNIGAGLVPYVDNAYNANLISKTPYMSTPEVRKSYNAVAMPMNTTYNIDPALNDANTYYRNFTKNIDENTSSSQVGRANKLGAFAELLNNRSRLYGNKENIENQMKNQQIMNLQGITNQNTQNAQGVANQNLGLTDEFNYRNFQRTNDINQMKSANVSNMVSDATKQIQDRNMKQTQQGQILYNSLAYGDGAGISAQIGTPQFNDMIKNNPEYRASLYNKLKTTGQIDAIARFEQLYGKP